MAGSALEEWYTTVDAAHRDAVRALRRTIGASLPAGFEEAMSYGMPSWVVPHSRYPGGYHVNPDVPLPFVSLGSQKRHIGLYHMGLYAHPPLLTWFRDAWPQHMSTRLNMGKSCVRFTNPRTVPLALVGELCSRMSVDQWIEIYEAQRPR